jgi:hypothetical protein
MRQELKLGGATPVATVRALDEAGFEYDIALVEFDGDTLYLRLEEVD